jgi:hypothetical protein
MNAHATAWAFHRPFGAVLRAGTRYGRTPALGMCAVAPGRCSAVASPLGGAAEAIPVNQREAARICGVGLTFFREHTLAELKTARRGSSGPLPTLDAPACEGTDPVGVVELRRYTLRREDARR